MKYRRTYKGFFVEIEDLKADKAGDMLSVKAEVFSEDGGVRLCKAELDGGYAVQGIVWSDSGMSSQLDIAKVGLSHHNAHALNGNEVQRYFPSSLENDPDVFQAMLEHGVAVLVEDRMRDDYYRAHAGEVVFARTSKVRIPDQGYH